MSDLPPDPSPAPLSPEERPSGERAWTDRPPPGPRPGYGPPPRPYPPRPQGRSPLPWILLALGLIGVGGCAFMALVAAAAGGGGAGVKRKLIEDTVEGEGDDKVLLVTLEGVIARAQGGGLFAVPTDPVESIKRQLEQAEKDPQVKAVLLAIDSPGGAVTASDEIHHELTGFRARSHKPVVVAMGSMCASGGVYVAVAADKIVCQPTTITGSIGVILSGLNFHDLLEKYGVQDVTVTSGPNKALLNPTSPVRDEHRQILQHMIDDAYGRFVKLVAEGRGLDEETVRGFADGRIYTPSEALQLKLVDQIGYREDALALARSLGNCPNSRLVEYRRQPTLADMLSGNARSPLSIAERLDPAILVEELRAPRLLALWRPN